ncbi:MAG TPA: HAD-IA family hydrolase [Ignavibacteriaceae bacterium]|nr:HAD-IA family hydrolase [Ignavibacteriaceae bacterium]
MVKTIIFDLSEVLIAGLIGIEKELAPLVNLSENDFLEALWTDSFWELMKGKITEDEYLADVFEKNNWNIDKNIFRDVIRKNFHNEVDGMIELIEELSKDYKLLLLSDHSEEWVKYINEVHPFLNLFHKKYFSFQFGEIKREKRAFALLLKENNLNASDCLFIDDSPANIKAAEEVGLKGIQFSDIEHLKAGLNRT